MDIPDSSPGQTIQIQDGANHENVSIRPLRNDLRLKEAGRVHGSPVWMINDLSANRFFTIGWQEFEILSRWHMNDANAIIEDIRNTTTLRPTMQDITQLLTFLRINNLLVPQGRQERDVLKKAYLKKRHIGLSTLIKNYLFFKIPLWRPDAFLDKLVPHLGFLFSKASLFIFVVLAVCSLLLVAGQWTNFKNTFIYFFTFEGVIISGLGIFISQFMHEMGHAVVAKRLGLKVPVMGAAFLVMFPIVYTDTTDAWKLQTRRERMSVNIAGIVTDIALAVIATFLWYVLPDGSLRSACFIMASVSWVMTLLMNLNPFMRFDGYYLLADGLRIENMQERSFEHAKWFLRRNIWGWSKAPPENPPRWQHYYMIAYSFSVWIYRFFLFLGIALMVYHLFFKLLGLILMAIELIYFIVIPIVREMLVWWKQRKDITMNRISQTSLAVLIVLIMILFIPWQGRIEAPALLKSGMETTVYAPVSARIEQQLVKNGDAIKKGDLLFVLRSDKLPYDKRAAELDARRYQTNVTRGAVAGDWREQKLVSARNLSASEASIAAIAEQEERLNIRAPFDGQVFDIDSETHEGRSVNPSIALAQLVSPSSHMITAYVRERDLDKIGKGATAYFESDMPSAPIKGVIDEIDPIAVRELEDDILASDFKGGIAARRNDKGRYIPHEAVYRVQIRIKNDAAGIPVQTQRGWASIQGERTSIAGNVIRRANSVLMKEASFN